MDRLCGEPGMVRRTHNPASPLQCVTSHLRGSLRGWCASHVRWVTVAVVLSLSAGCAWFTEDHYLAQRTPGAEHYLTQATEVSYPDSDTSTPHQAYAADPRRLRNPTEDEIWDLPLQQALHLALSNSEIIKSSGAFLSPGNPLLASPEMVASIYDPAIQETGVLFGRRGVEAALAEFDAQFTTNMIWGRNEAISNNTFNSGGLAPGSTLVEDSAGFSTSIQKRFATGGQFAVTHDWDYSWNNSPTRLFPSLYEGSVRAELRQPLLAGGGVGYTRIAGPVSQSIQGVTGVGQGVVIARIDGDIAIADFEIAVSRLLRDVEQTYWRLAQAYQTYHSEVVARNEAESVWENVTMRAEVQAPGGGAADVARAAEHYYQSRIRAETALDSLYALEAELRRLMGLAVNDGAVIRPADVPYTGEIIHDWNIALADALSRRPELRRQKWSIKSLDLQLTAARSLTRPRLDFVSAYRVNAFGDDLYGDPNEGLGLGNLGSAYHRLTAGDQTGWNLGFEFSIPIGQRFAHAQVRNFELRLIKAQAALRAQEIEISHELAAAFRDLDRTFLAMENQQRRKIAAERRYTALQQEYQAEPERITLDDVLRARDTLSQVEIALHTSVSNYNIARADLYYRCGRLLDYDNVWLQEGAWDSEAYEDVEHHAQARANAIPGFGLKNDLESLTE